MTWTEIILIAVLAAAVFFALRRICRKKTGGCSCGCSGCSRACDARRK